MKLLAASILIILTLSSALAFTPAPYDSCSCRANDQSCSTNITCPGGCFAFCGNNANCNAVCLKDDESDPVLSTQRHVTLRFKGSSSREVAAELARIAGTEVSFSPSTPDATFDMDVENLPFWNVLEILSQSGRIQLGRYDFAGLRRVRLALLNGERITLCVNGATVKRFASQLRLLTGFDVRVTSGNPNAIVNYTGRDVNFNEILAQVSERTGVQLEIK